MIYAVYIASSEGKRGQPVRHRFCCYHNNVRQVSFAITDQVQCFCPAVLRPIAAHGILCRNTCMKDGLSAVRFPDISHLADAIVNYAQACIDLIVFIQVTVYHNIRCNEIIISERSGQLRILGSKRVQVSEVLILSKITGFQLIIVTELKNCPSSGTQILKLRKSLPEELHC